MIKAKNFKLQNAVPTSRGDEIGLTFKGWGYFDLGITVHWVKELNMEPYELEHELYFDDTGKWETHAISFPKSILNRIKQAKQVVVQAPSNGVQADQPAKKAAAKAKKTKIWK